MIKNILFQKVNYQDFKGQTMNCIKRLKDFFDKNNLNAP